MRKKVRPDGWSAPGWFLRPVELARFFGKVDEKKAAAEEATQENRKRAQSDGGS